MSLLTDSKHQDCTTNELFTSEQPKRYHVCSCPNACDAFFWTAFLFDLVISCIDKLLGFLWALMCSPGCRFILFFMKGTSCCPFLMISRLVLLTIDY